jgi:hypothetical protein
MNPTIGNIMLRVKCAVYNAFTDGESGMSCVSKHTEQAITEAQAAVEQALTPGEPTAWLESPYGSIRMNPNMRMDFPPQSLKWRITLYLTPPQPHQWVGLTDDQRTALIDARNEAMQWALKGRIPESGAFAGIAQNLDFLCNQIAGSPKD